MSLSTIGKPVLKTLHSVTITIQMLASKQKALCVMCDFYIRRLYRLIQTTKKRKDEQIRENLN